MSDWEAIGNPKNHCKILLERLKSKYIWIKSFLQTKIGYTIRAWNEKDHKWIPQKRKNRQRDQIASEWRQCSAFLGISAILPDLSFLFLESGETIDDPCCQEQLAEMNRTVSQKRLEHKNDNTNWFSLMTMLRSTKLGQLTNCFQLIAGSCFDHVAYAPDLAATDFYLFASNGCALSKQCLYFRNLKNELMTGSKQNWKSFWGGVYKLPKRWDILITSDGVYLQ